MLRSHLINHLHGILLFLRSYHLLLLWSLFDYSWFHEDCRQIFAVETIEQTGYEIQLHFQCLRPLIVTGVFPFLSQILFVNSLSHIFVPSFHSLQSLKSHRSLIKTLKKQHHKPIQPYIPHALNARSIVSIVAPPSLQINDFVFEWPVNLVQFVLISEMFECVYLFVDSGHGEHLLLLLQRDHL